MKNEILNLVRDHFNTSIAQLEESVNEMKVDADMDENATTDPEDYSHANESKDMELRLRLLADRAKESLARLDGFDKSSSVMVEPGAVVKTNGPWFVIGISTPKIDHGNTFIIGLSEDAPLYGEIQGKVKGDTIQLGKEKYLIEEIM